MSEPNREGDSPNNQSEENKSSQERMGVEGFQRELQGVVDTLNFYDADDLDTLKSQRREFVTQYQNLTKTTQIDDSKKSEILENLKRIKARIKELSESETAIVTESPVVDASGESEEVKKDIGRVQQLTALIEGQFATGALVDGDVDKLQELVEQLDGFTKSYSQGKIIHAASSLLKRLDLAKKEQSPRDMATRDLIAYLKRKGIRLSAQGYGAENPTEVGSYVVEFWSRKAGGKELQKHHDDDFWIEQTEIYSFILSNMVGKKSVGKVAAENRTSVYGPGESSWVNEFLLTREELLQITTYNPIFGNKISDAIHTLIDHSITEGGFYEKLVSDSGQDFLREVVRQLFPDSFFGQNIEKQLHEALLSIIWNTFIAFDFASIVLQEGQLRRKSRGTKHSSSSKGYEVVAVQNPMAYMFHSSYGYPGNERNGSQYLLPFNQISGQRMGYRGQGARAGKFGDLEKMKELVITYLNSQYDVGPLIDQIPELGLGKSLLSPIDIFFLSAEEKISVNGQIVYGTSLQISRSDVQGFGEYQLAEANFAEFLQLIIGSVPQNLKASDILGSSNKSGSEIGKITGLLGKTKVFYAERLGSILYPYLTDRIMRMYVSFVGNPEELIKLNREVIEKLEQTRDTAGLTSGPLKDSLTKTIRYLEAVDLRRIGPGRRKKERKRYATAYSKMFLKKDLPLGDRYAGTRFFKEFFSSPGSEEKEAIDIYTGENNHPPLTRLTELVPPKEDKKQ
ncbi:MAG: hypothetical protein H6774_02020 [Pseudomonadales bacterium]|nr:hypothetical protein [Candidatus Woesebacteria bacterium]MCB9801843.1 hypothetical protein [Pseudomonadales bacterium]